jgi:hypothetical protein
MYEFASSTTHSDIQVLFNKVLITMRSYSSGGSSEQPARLANSVIKAIVYFIFIPVLTLCRDVVAML